MPSPPDPLVSAVLLALLARLRWRSIGAPGLAGDELGLFLVDGIAEEREFGLYLEAGERWGAYAVDAVGLGPFAVTEATARVLAGATLGEDGALEHQGARFRLRALFERGRLTAVLVDLAVASSIDPTPPNPHRTGSV